MTTNVDAKSEPQRLDLPFGWEGADDAPQMDVLEPRFRFPAADDPAPGTRRLLGMSLWASVLGLAGVGVGLRGLLSVIGGGVPGWYAPVLTVTGLLGVALTVGAYLSIHRPLLPWGLLTAAAVPLTFDVILAGAY